MLDTKYGVVETSKIQATYMGGGHIFSVVDTSNDMEQGSIVTLGEPIKTNGLEEYAATTPAKGNKVVLIADVPLIYDESTTMKQAEYNYVNTKGKSTRAYELKEHDMYAVSDYMIAAISDEVEEGNYVVAKDRKYQEVAKDTDVSTYGFVAKVRYVTVKGFSVNALKMVMLEVVKNTEVA